MNLLTKPQTTLLLLAILIAAPSIWSTPDSNEPMTPFIWGLELAVGDLNQAGAFYTENLNFKLQAYYPSQRSALLNNGDVGLRLWQAASQPEPEAEVAHFNFFVDDLDGHVKRCLDAGATLFGTMPQDSQIGHYAALRDPWGNLFHLIQLNTSFRQDRQGTGVFNIGLRLPDLTVAETFYTGIGFQVFSYDYLPATLPLQRAGHTALVLHPSSDASIRSNALTSILLVSTQYQKDSAKLKRMALADLQEDTPLVGHLFRDPGGNRIKLVDAALVQASHGKP